MRTFYALAVIVVWATAIEAHPRHNKVISEACGAGVGGSGISFGACRTGIENID